MIKHGPPPTLALVDISIVFLLFHNEGTPGASLLSRLSSLGAEAGILTEFLSCGALSCGVSDTWIKFFS